MMRVFLLLIYIDMNSQRQMNLQVLKEDYSMTITCRDQNVQIIVIDIENGIRKLGTRVDFRVYEELRFIFEQPQRMLEYLKSEQNYVYSKEDSSLTLKWEIYGHNFERQLKLKIVLLECPLSQVQALKLEVMTLRKKLEVTKNQRISLMEEQDKIYKGQQNLRTNSKNQRKKQIKSNSLKKLRNQNLMEQIVQLVSEESNFSNQSQEQMRQKIKDNIFLDSQQEKENNYDNFKDKEINQKRRFIKNSEKQKERRANSKRPIENKKISLKKTKIISKKQKNNRKKIDPSPYTEAKADTYISGDSYSNVPQIEDYEVSLVENNKTRVDLPNGDYYIGDLKDRFFHGKGFYYSKQNGTYEGQWKNGLKQNYGKSIDNEGNVYEGFFKKGQKHGKGKQIYSNGEWYQGDFANDMKQGHGSYYFNNGDRYEGQWKNDMFNGKGKQFYNDGDMSYYEGRWLDDELHGEGVLVKNFVSYKQKWENGKLISSMKVEF